MGYTKLFSSIVASTIWREDDKTRLVWITMLALKNERHVVEASLPGLADLARVTIGECEKAIGKLEGKDKYSRSQEFEGRRIEKCDGGWRILNGEHYRKHLSAEDRREYQRLYQREYRKVRRGKEWKRGAKVAGAKDGVMDALEEAKADEGYGRDVKLREDPVGYGTNGVEGGG